MSEASKQPSTRYLMFGENTLPQLLMKPYSATFPMRGENFGDRLFASWHSAVSPVCGEDRRSGLRVRTEGAAFPVRRENPFRNAFCFPVTKVPVSPTAALHSKVLCSLHGRMSSDPP